MNLNQIRAITLTLLTAGLVYLGFTAPLWALILALMIVVGFMWIVTETGVHASYTMEIGQLLSMIFRGGAKKEQLPEPEQILLDEGLQLSNEKAKMVIYNPEETKKEQDAKHGKISPIYTDTKLEDNEVFTLGAEEISDIESQDKQQEDN